MQNKSCATERTRIADGQRDPHKAGPDVGGGEGGLTATDVLGYTTVRTLHGGHRVVQVRSTPAGRAPLPPPRSQDLVHQPGQNQDHRGPKPLHRQSHTRTLMRTPTAQPYARKLAHSVIHVNQGRRNISRCHPVRSEQARTGIRLGGGTVCNSSGGALSSAMDTTVSIEKNKRGNPALC